MNITNWQEGMEITAPCIIANMPNEAYHASPGISKSGLDLVDRSPAHYRYAADRQATRAMEIGTAIHTALLEPDRFAAEYVLLREVTDRRSSAYKEAIKHHDSEVVLTGKEADLVAGMQEAVYAHAGARDLLIPKWHRELSVFAHDPETGTLCRARFDSIGRGVAVDLKKTQDARPDAFSRSVANYRYFVQDAFYRDVWEWATGEALESFKFLAVEEQMPHAVGIYQLDEDAVRHGRDCYRRNLDAYAECMAVGEWPAYQQDTEQLSLPSWMMAQIENEIVEEIY